MNKLFAKIAGLSIGLAMAIGVGVAAGSNKELTPVHADSGGWNLTDASYDTASANAVVYSNAGATVTVNKGSGTNANNYLGGANAHTRWYNGNTMTVTPKSGYQIDSFSITATTSSYQKWTVSSNGTGSGTTTYTVTPTDKTATVNLSSSATGRYTAMSVTYSAVSTESLTAITGITATITAVAGADDWTITNIVVTGTLSVAGAGQNITSLVDVTVNTAVPTDASNSFPVSVTASKKSTTAGTAADFTTTINAVVEENPFSNLAPVKSTSSVTTSGVYTFSNDGARFAGTTVSSSYMNYPITAANVEGLGYFRFESVTGGYYLKYVVKNAQTGVWEDRASNKYVNNSSSTTLAVSGTGSSVWTLAAMGSGDSARVYITNSSNSNRHMGLNGNDATTATQIRAYASTNLSSNLPVYLYEVPQDTLQSLSISGQTTSFTAGSTFSLGGATLTAHYSESGDTTDLSGGTLSYTINNVSVTTSTVLNHDDHNGKTVVVTYTDEAGKSASAIGYTITVNYKPVTSISLNITEHTLAKGGTVVLSATVTDEFADHTVSWESDDTSIATVSAATGASITVTASSANSGTATITATAGLQSATCEIEVSAEQILDILDENENVITGSTINKFTGDDTVMLMADSQNDGGSPVFEWESSDDSVVSVEAVDEMAEITIEGAGSADVSVTVGELTRSVTFSVSASGVTSLTLTSSVPSGEIYDGTYNNTLTLTPSITVVGNATKVINWVSSNTSVASISAAQTTDAAITVTGLSEGTSTITATSAYTPAQTVQFVITVSEDGVNTLGWTKRPKFNSSTSGFSTIWANETTLGDLIANNGSDGIGIFTPVWYSGKSDAPSFGTGEGQVHIGLYNVGAPTSEGAPIDSSYVFKASDNGKYVVAFYEGTSSKSNTQLTVTKWRSVIDSSDASGTITWSSSSATVTGEASATVTNVQYTYYENNSLRLGTGSGGGQIKIDTDANIVSVVVTAKAYSDSRTGTLTVGDQSVEVTNTDYVEFDLLTLDTPSKSIVVSTPSSNVRINIQSIVINCSGSQQIGKTEDCLGLETFIDTYLHMDKDVEGQCVEYYGKNTETGAKYHFNQLNAHQKSLFTSNSAYIAEWARLSSWAAANGESLNTTTNVLSASRIAGLLNVGESVITTIIIVAISSISLATVGGYFLFRRRKEQ